MASMFLADVNFLDLCYPLRTTLLLRRNFLAIDNSSKIGRPCIRFITACLASLSQNTMSNCVAIQINYALSSSSRALQIWWTLLVYPLIIQVLDLDSKSFL